MAQKDCLVLYEMCEVRRGLVWSVSTELAIVMRGVSVEWCHDASEIATEALL